MRKLSLPTLAAFALLAAPSAFAQTAAPGTVPAKPGTAAPAASAARTPPIDINTATAAELDVLPGVGPARAQAIVKGRPYKSKDELLRKKVIPENVYNGIKDRIVAHQKG
jgi:DNA uptake protein ComE-like DNA-binding protein